MPINVDWQISIKWYVLSTLDCQWKIKRQKDTIIN